MSNGNTEMNHAAGQGGSETPPPLQKWFLSARPFSLPASTMPVIFGTVLAITVGGSPFSLLKFVAAFFGMAILHLGANLLSDVFDFRKGLDTQVNPVSGGVVRGWITPKESMYGSFVCFAVGGLLGLWLLSQVPALLWIGVPGILIGVLYSWGPFPLKYNGLGDLAVFLNFGVLGSLGAWTVQTGTMSWIPAVWIVPSSLLVIGILHANNWRDIAGDGERRVVTMASLFGDGGSTAYYGFLLFFPFAFYLGYIVLSHALDWRQPMPWTLLAVFLSLPLAIRLFGKGLRRHRPDNPLDWLALDGATAQLNLLFGLLATAGLGLHALIS